MPRILVLSSWVARGHVGLSAAVPVLQTLGVDATALPTILLSNHPGHRHAAGEPVPVSHLTAMLNALEQNGWLAEIDAVLTGYMPALAHVAWTAHAIDRIVRANAKVQVWCDPVLGDDPGGLYRPAEVAAALRERLLPVAHAITPNRFELEWLSRQPVPDATAAVAAARALRVPLTLATSIPAGPSHLGDLAATAEGAWMATTPLLAGVPHGTGDALAAMTLAARLTGRTVPETLALAAAQITALIAASSGRGELSFLDAQAWRHALPARVEQLT